MKMENGSTEEHYYCKCNERFYSTNIKVFCIQSNVYWTTLSSYIFAVIIGDLIQTDNKMSQEKTEYVDGSEFHLPSQCLSYFRLLALSCLSDPLKIYTPSRKLRSSADSHIQDNKNNFIIHNICIE